LIVMSVTRRSFLERIGQTGGGVAVHGAMRSLGLAGSPASHSFWPAPAERAPTGTRVIVLGAGIAGLTAAYELQKLGYQCEVLEARSRTGGRCFTIRRGQVSEEVGAPTQRATFDPDLYLNAGPARIPHHHTTTLAYCRELGVAIEPFCSVNEAAYVHHTSADTAGQRLRLREVRADWRGHTSELLAKAVAADSLDRPLTRDDRERILEWLRQEGGLSAALRYSGSARRGYKSAPGFGTAAGVVGNPLALEELLKTSFSRYLASELAMQTPMFQIAGGTDNLARAFASKVSHITLGADVIAIEQPAGRVRVRYTTASGATRDTEGTYCISTLPLTMLRDVALDAAPELRDAIQSISYSSAGKIGLQFSRRFWEEDDGIFGGITRTDQEIAQILYPSTGYLSKKGILVGYYLTGQAAVPMGQLPPAERQRRALEQGARIHPQYGDTFENAFSIAWQNVGYSKGGWAQFTEAQRKREYLTLLRPDRALYLAGDYTTYLSGWMAGAMESARTVVSAIHERTLRATTTATAGRASGNR
jgi:monoamine oxidase